MATPQPAPPLIVKSVTSPPAAVPPNSPVAASGWMNVAPVPGATYFQLMSVEPGVAEVFAEGLHSEGFDAIAAAGASPAVHRVLVGPLNKSTGVRHSSWPRSARLPSIPEALFNSRSIRNRKHAGGGKLGGETVTVIAGR